MDTPTWYIEGQAYSMAEEREEEEDAFGHGFGMDNSALNPIHEEEAEQGTDIRSQSAWTEETSAIDDPGTQGFQHSLACGSNDADSEYTASWSKADVVATQLASDQLSGGSEEAVLCRKRHRSREASPWPSRGSSSSSSGQRCVPALRTENSEALDLLCEAGGGQLAQLGQGSSKKEYVAAGRGLGFQLDCHGSFLSAANSGPAFQPLRARKRIDMVIRDGNKRRLREQQEAEKMLLRSLAERLRPTADTSRGTVQRLLEKHRRTDTEQEGPCDSMESTAAASSSSTAC